MEQKLIDLMFQMVLTAATHTWFDGKTQEQIAEWVRNTLEKNGITVVPMGSSHGVLKD